MVSGEMTKKTRIANKIVKLFLLPFNKIKDLSGNMIRILAFGMFLVIAITIPGALAVVSEKSRTKLSKHLSSSPASEKVEDKEAQNKENSDQLRKITEIAQSYKENPSSETYTELWQNFDSWIHKLVTRHVDASSLCKSCPNLSKAGLKIIDVAGSGGTTKIYTFSPQAILPQGKANLGGQSNNSNQELKPLVSPNANTTIDSRDFLIQSTDTTISETGYRPEKKHGKSRRTRLRTTHLKKVAILHAQSINMPAGVEIRQACIFNGAGGKTRFLAILGWDLQSGHAWTYGLKRSSTGWIQFADLWQQVPSFLLQSGQAKTKFSENNLVITIGGNSGAENAGSTGGYELVMPFVENHFSLTRNEALDPARGVALQFLLAIQAKRPDLAKIWLLDPQLASIPGYLGLYARPAGSSLLKLVNMSPPLNGGIRFRIITGTKDDLILDIGKFKGQWLVKALFIASADELSREIGRFVPSEGQ